MVHGSLQRSLLCCDRLDHDGSGSASLYLYNWRLFSTLGTHFLRPRFLVPRFCTFLAPQHVCVLHRNYLLHASLGFGLPPPDNENPFDRGQVVKIHAAINKQLLTPSGGRGGSKRKKSEEAKAAITAISKTLSKMDHPKGSGLLEVGDIQNVVSRSISMGQ